MIRVVLPFHLRNLAGITGEAAVDVKGTVTLQNVLDALEAKYPVLRGTIRDHGTLARRKLVRFFVCKEDWSDKRTNTELPAAIAQGTEPLMIVGAMAGG